MKKLIVILLLFAVAGPLYAQVSNPADQAKSDASSSVNNNVNSTVDNGVNKAESAIKGLFKKKKKDNSSQPQAQQASVQQNNPPAQTSQPANAGSSTGNIKDYKNYDFIPGDKIIFQSQLGDESVGEIPSQFTLANGQMDIQQEDGENTIHIPTGPGATMTPRMKNATYMPDQFTIEFDVKNERFPIDHVMVDFGHRTNEGGGEGIVPGMTFSDGGISWTLGDVDYPGGFKADDQAMKWHHVAIAINKSVGKAYIDQYRVANVNNLAGKVNNITIDVNGYENSWIKNVRIAAGGIDMYKEATTDSKIVTHGILFDVNKAVIKPESMGTINMLYSVLTKTPTLKFEIDGHTDNTGNSANNLTLSQQRADAVKAQLVAMGIDASRLTTKGYGDSKPMAPNDTPENKAINRRVELIKTN